VVGVLIGLKVATLRHAWRGSQSAYLWSGAIVGVLLALWTLAIVAGAADVPASFDLLAIVFGLWAAAWILLPVVGGTGGDPLRPENFRLLGLPPRRLAIGLLAAGAVGVLPGVSLLAFVGLVVSAIGLGAPAIVLAAVAIGVMLALVIALSRVVVGALGRAMETRLGLELAALQYALIIGLSFFWIPLSAVAAERAASGSSAPTIDLPLGDVARVLPTGWGVVAVEAAGLGDWRLALAGIFGQVVVVGLLAWAWSAIVARRLELSSGGGTRVALPGGRLGRIEKRLVPATPLGSVIGRELRAWMRHPRRTLELRVALWCGVLLAILPGLLGTTILWPWAGAIVVVIAGVGLANVYGMDGSAFWLTLLAPGSERVDVRGRQAAWLLVAGGIAVAGSLIFSLASGHPESWPFVAAALPALLGAAAGLGILLAVVTPAALPERRGGDPLDLGDDPSTGGNLMVHGVAMTLGVPVLALPASIVALAAAPAGVLVGVVTGVVYAWIGGALAIWRLRRAGPETLEALRARPAAQRVVATEPGEVPLSRSRSAARSVLFIAGALLVFPQGIVAIIIRLTGSESRLWFAALYLPDPWPIPAAIGAILLGLGAWYVAWRIGRRPPGPTPS
jgi:ABC-2 type transport system permease protein